MSFAQIKLVSNVATPKYSLLALNDKEIHAGDHFNAFFPDGWHNIKIEMRDNIDGPGCWYISTPGFGDISPIGLFVEI